MKEAMHFGEKKGDASAKVGVSTDSGGGATTLAEISPPLHMYPITESRLIGLCPRNELL